MVVWGFEESSGGHQGYSGYYSGYYSAYSKADDSDKPRRSKSKRADSDGKAHADSKATRRRH